MSHQRFISVLRLVSGVAALPALLTFWSIAHSAIAQESMTLDLDRADLERIGVALQRPQRALSIEVASGPAEVVIPPAQQAIVGALTGGVLSRTLVAEGDAVTSGQTLAEIASTEVIEWQREFVAAAAEAELATAQLERDIDLHRDGIIAERRLQESRAAKRIADSAFELARERLVLAGMTGAQLDSLARSGVIDSRLAITAPFDAVVVEQFAALGARIGPLDPLYRVADLSRLWIEVHVSPERAASVEPGMRVDVDVDGQSFQAEVIQVGSVVDNENQTVVVRAQIDAPDSVLRAGRFLQARILASGETDNVLLAVPSAAVVRDGGQAWVFTASDGALMVRPVDVVTESSGTSYLAAALDGDAQIAVSGVAALKSAWLEARDAED